VSVPVPYFDDGQVCLYVGDCREILPALGVTADLVLADPPYVSTSLGWDRWPDGWLEVAAGASRSMWCFGTLRLFMDRAGEFTGAGWKLSHDVIWEKHNGSGFAADRFRGVHETVAHFYRGSWESVYRDVPRGPAEFDGKNRSTSAAAARTPHTGAIGGHYYADDGLRLARSVQRIPSVRRGLSKTQKPVPLLRLLGAYGCPAGGLVVAPFAGSGSDLEAARLAGMRAIGIERDPEQAEKAARRLSQATLFGGAA
jgi:site-specific DNA-methyltransferase (adenine-specific)